MTLTQAQELTQPAAAVPRHGLWIAGEEVSGSGDTWLPVIYPHTNEPFAEVSVASADDVDRAVRVADGVFRSTMRRMPAFERAAILERAAQLIGERSEALGQVIAREVGKPIRDARFEAKRGVDIFKLAAAAGRELTGEVLPMDALSGGQDRWGLVVHEPVGVVAAIGPFNAPLNLVAQKVAPALAAGNTVVLKPASKTPLTSLFLARVLHDAGLPAGALNVVVGSGASVGDPLVQHPLVRFVTFTGGVEAGRRIRAVAGLKRVALELGSNSPNIVCADADLSAAATAIARAGFGAAGQQCISAQRVFVQQPVYEPFVAQLVAAAEALNVGDPMQEDTDVGPLVAPGELERLESWIAEARAQGARVLTGGQRQGYALLPTILADTHERMAVRCQEVFGPILTVTPFADPDEAIRMANDSVFGLQGGVFTRDLNLALRFGRELELGSVWINEASRYRQDNYPFGGVKDSGLGREGVKYAIQDMTELKFIGIKTG